jgi:hypothetical protein
MKVRGLNMLQIILQTDPETNTDTQVSSLHNYHSTSPYSGDRQMLGEGREGLEDTLT